MQNPGRHDRLVFGVVITDIFKAGRGVFIAGKSNAQNSQPVGFIICTLPIRSVPLPFCC